jgi:hypothetical protein
MKGIVFSEFLDFVAQRFGEDMVDDVIDDCPLESGGAYTAVGTYDPAEMACLCRALAARTERPVDALLRSFGEHLSGSFARGYPGFFTRSAHLFDFLESIEAHIHVEVRKLYPDAELPTFAVQERGAKRLVMDYRSPRRLAAMAQGLIEGVAPRFGVSVRVRGEPLDGPHGEATRFTVEID